MAELEGQARLGAASEEKEEPGRGAEETDSPRIRIQQPGDQDEASADDTLSSEIPGELPILPLRGLVVYPHTAVPLTIGQPRSIALVDDVAAGTRLVGLVASKNPELDMPGPEDLYAYGTVGTIQRLFRAPDGTIRLIVHGLARFKLGEFTVPRALPGGAYRIGT